MFPMDRKPFPVSVEYLKGGKRVVKHFPDAYLARRFYGVKLKDGADPKVVKSPAPVPA